MSTGSARIDSPDVIKDFRNQFLKFEQTCRQGLSGASSDVDRIMQWLRHDQLLFWKQELRKSEELLSQARSQYLLARHGSDYLRKPSYVEEQKALKKAERRKEEAQKKLEAVKKWSAMLEQQADKLMGPIDNFSGLLDTMAPKALSRLEVMIRNLEDYLRDSPGGS